ncbi:MAG: transporter substrate-binding domain-containing protein [Alphaproteobacteria bacterium]|nr:transporter substrate-binding domain-containing protein [Alphaproteobacteria bacterium]MBT5653997.1 transporter substrate-binding domain-containing protein [Alphaproteobacteria bacterium]
MKYLPKISLLVSMLMSLFLVACDDSNVSTDDRPIVVGISADNPPFEFYKTEGSSQEIVGFEIDLIKALSEEMGQKMELKDMDFSGIIPALQAGRIQMAVAGLGPSEERRKSVDFSEPYFYVKNALLFPTGSDFPNLKNYKGKKIGVQLGSTQENAVKIWAKTHKGIEVETRTKLGDLIQELLSGRIDGAIFDGTAARAYHKANEAQISLQDIDEDNGEGTAMAFPKGSDLVAKANQALSALRSKGVIQKLHDKWLKVN